MKITRRQLSLIIENYLKQDDMLFEVKKKSFNQFMARGLMTQQEFDMYVFRNDWVPPFTDPVIRKVLFNTLSADEGHSIREIAERGQEFLERIVNLARTPDPDNPGQNMLKPTRVRGTSGVNPNDVIDINSKIDVDNPDNTTATYNDMSNYLENRSGIAKRDDVLTKAIQEGFAGTDTSNFEVIPAPGSPYIVTYPKTYKGSIAVARMGPDFQYYDPNTTTGRHVIGKMTWCTSVDSAGNMFLNYHRSQNLHMYYLVKVKDYNPTSPDRKLCLSFAKTDYGDIIYRTGHSSVDGDNKALSEEDAKKYIGQGLFETIVNDVKRPERLVINPVKYYRSINLEQYIDMRNAHQNEQDTKLFAKEAEQIAKYTESNDIINAILGDNNPIVASVAYPYVKDSKVFDSIISKSNITTDDLISLFSAKALQPQHIKKIYMISRQAGKADPDIMINAANHTATPLEILNLIFDDALNNRLAQKGTPGRMSYNRYSPLYVISQLVRSRNASSDLLRKVYSYLNENRNIDLTNSYLPLFASHPNTPPDLIVKEIEGLTTLSSNPMSAQAGTSRSGHDRNETAFMLRNIIGRISNEMFEAVGEKTFQKILDYFVMGDMESINPSVNPKAIANRFAENPRLSLEYALRMFEYAMSKESEPKPRGKESLTLRWADVATAFAETISLYVYPVSEYIDENPHYNDYMMEVAMPLSEQDMDGSTEIHGLLNQFYGKTNTIQLQNKLEAYIQKYSERPESDNPDYNGYAQKLLKIAKEINRKKQEYNQYSQKTGFRFPSKYNNMFDN